MPQYSVFPQLVIFSSKGREDGCVSSGGAGAGRGVGGGGGARSGGGSGGFGWSKASKQSLDVRSFHHS